MVSVCAESRFVESHSHLVSIVPVRDGQWIGEPPEFVHKVKLVPHQKHGHNQLHLQLGHLHPCTRVPASAPTEEGVGGVRERVGSQPPTRVVLVRIGVVFGVQMDVTQRIREEISPFYHLFADFHLSAEVPSEEEESNRDSL